MNIEDIIKNKIERVLISAKRSGECLEVANPHHTHYVLEEFYSTRQLVYLLHTKQDLPYPGYIVTKCQNKHCIEQSHLTISSGKHSKKK